MNTIARPANGICRNWLRNGRCCESPFRFNAFRTPLKHSRFRISHAQARWQSTDHLDKRTWSTPLAKNLTEAISTTGPVPVATYMRQCLTGDISGYYSSEKVVGDQFGRKGDFVTSPEISQIFGELVGLWVLTEWTSQGLRGRNVHLTELGPGRGTLMDDMLRTLQNFKSLADSVQTIYLVEASKNLRETQHRLLCGDSPLETTETGHKSKCKYFSNTDMIWCEDMKFIPKDDESVPFIVAHEFFDALPIHIFQSIEIPTTTSSTNPSTTESTPAPSKPNEWRELLVNPVSPYDRILESQPNKSNLSPDFELVMSQTPTPHSQLLPRLSNRYKKLLQQAGSIIEISPQSQALASEFARRIGGAPNAKKNNSPGGAALILDYGTADNIPTNSLRGIQTHKAVSPFANPGAVDISADVDFLGLAHAALDASPGVEVHGPVEQAVFLGAMGIKERADMLIKKAGADEEITKRIEDSWRRLVDRGPDGMGKTYKAMAIVPHHPEKEMRRPVGFGGDIRA